jgi:predicted dehydrogenase/threonine dehydrogenase-like Zn-dependent dehydrogenase
MKLVVAEAGEVKVLEVPRPVCGPGDVLVKTAYSVISTGTESWSIDSTEPISPRDLAGDTPRLQKALRLANEVREKEGVRGLVDYVKTVRRPRVTLGYSLTGEVIEVGKRVTDISIGENVACVGEGKASHAEFAAVPRNLVTKIPAEVDMQSAAFVALGAIAIHALRQSQAQVGDSVVVIGAGLVGNLVVQACKAAGCRVAAIDAQPQRLDLAKLSGADLVALNTDEKLLDHIQHFTRGRGADVVFICASTASSDPVNTASAVARDRGLVLIVGRVGMDFDRKLYYQKELNIRMSRSLGPGRYDPAYEEKGVDYPLGYVRWTLNRNMESFLDLLGQGSIKVQGLVEGVVPVEEASRAYERVKSGNKVAILLQYGGGKVPTSSATSVPLLVRPADGKVGVALIGPGGFAKETLLPLLRTEKDFDLRWVISSNPTHALDAAQRYHVQNCGTDLDDALRDLAVGLVVISTPNNLHYEMATRAAKAGKVAFVEKPLCTKEEDLRDFERSKETGSRIIVGFNRRYSSYALELKSTMGRLNGPFLINYRVNSDLAPLSRWSEDPEVGGGRVIHECCHFFDLFNFLLGSRATSASVIPTEVSGSTSVSVDNFVATLKYADGSVASLTYSSLGNKNAERERIEVFGQGTVMVLDDFKCLTTYNRAGQRNTFEHGPDKGHRSEFLELAKLLKGRPHSLVSFDEIVAAMRDTFMVDTQLRSPDGSSAHG